MVNQSPQSPSWGERGPYKVNSELAVYACFPWNSRSSEKLIFTVSVSPKGTRCATDDAPRFPLGLPEPGGLRLTDLSPLVLPCLASICYCFPSVLLPGPLPLSPQITHTVCPPGTRALPSHTALPGHVQGARVRCDQLGRRRMLCPVGLTSPVS